MWKLPCVYICENNQYGMGTSLARAMSLQDIAQKAYAYDVASEFVDGMDVLAVRATLRAVERARRESLPTLLEVRTYRFMGHSMSDPGNYRTRAEIEKHQERDPIKLFTSTLKRKTSSTTPASPKWKNRPAKPWNGPSSLPKPAPNRLPKNSTHTSTRKVTSDK
ncbi:MAG: thiamine pyrophosphate-dependent enzyme [Pyrinomonadaceae bacterium]